MTFLELHSKEDPKVHGENHGSRNVRGPYQNIICHVTVEEGGATWRGLQVYPKGGGLLGDFHKENKGMLDHPFFYGEDKA